MEQVEINKSIKLSEHLASPSEAALSHLSELNGVHLSPHFSLGELTVTNVKTVDGRSAQGDALLAKNIPSHVNGWSICGRSIICCMMTGRIRL